MAFLFLVLIGTLTVFLAPAGVLDMLPLGIALMLAGWILLKITGKMIHTAGNRFGTWLVDHVELRDACLTEVVLSAFFDVDVDKRRRRPRVASASL
jgi:hypothetical protein